MAPEEHQTWKRERARVILGRVVETHIATGSPVGSRSVAESMQGSLSSASVRAVMHDLDRQGLLEQSHVSSGRVPTDAGYREYLDNVLDHVPVVRADSSQFSGLEWSDDKTVGELLKSAASLLANRLQLAGMISEPRLDRAVLEAITFVWLRPGRLLAVVVTQAGVVHERRLCLDEPLERREVDFLNNYLNSFIRGMTLREVRSCLEYEQRRARAELSRLERAAVELGRRAAEYAEEVDVIVDGATTVLTCEELAVPERSAELLRWLGRRASLLEILDRAQDTPDTTVYLGSEMGASSFEPCALVTAEYRTRVGRGVVAVLGPKRLDYRRTIPMVRSVAARLTDLLGVDVSRS